MEKRRESEIQSLKKLLAASRHAVFFGGAGVSTASGIPDFRGNGGIYKSEETDADYPPEYMLSHACLTRQPLLFYTYYRRHMLYPNTKPNAAHLALAGLEREGRIKAVITQNIDGLHQAAGSKTVYELHGTTAKNYCASCGTVYGRDIVENSTQVPLCARCGGTVRPDVVLYGEGLDEATFSGAVRELYKADLLIVGGTSLTVHPAAGLVAGFAGKIAIINLDPTPYDYKADVLIHDKVDTVLPTL